MVSLKNTVASTAQSKEMMSLFVLVLQLLSILQLAAGANISMPGCIDQCGAVEIPYPFGVGPNCYHDKSYEIICNQTFNPPKPFLRRPNFEVLDINWPGRYSQLDPRYELSQEAGQILRVGFPAADLCGSDGAGSTPVRSSYDLRGTPFLFSRWYNVFMVEGCGGSVVLKDRSGVALTGCAAVCDNDAGSTNNETTCFGVGCCQASLMSSPKTDVEYFQSTDAPGLDYYDIALDLGKAQKSSPCNTTAAMIRSSSVNSLAGKLSKFETSPTVLEWQPTYISQQIHLDNVSCYNAFSTQCQCGFAYEGNPFLPDGCQVVEACRKCRHRCHINPNNNNTYTCAENLVLRRASVIGFSSGMGLVLLVLFCYWLYRFLKRRKAIKQKEKYFKRNGGLLLQQQISSNEGVVETTKIFVVSELEKATDNFNDNRILGQGGQGTVYKGMLMDGRCVAIKKAKKVDESQVEPFINEVVILSQINHRNVVKLLGCCLETEVPILVYEYIPNGTLYQHIHGQAEDFHINWKMRLQIAAEAAGAMAYLHSSSSAPIYHRDIKSANILLDAKYRARVSDFGTSRAITIDQTHVTTGVQGTYGYLDPEYFQSNQFTEKSDVYSFGVVLVELLTGKKPICPTGSGGWISLATEFLTQMEASRLSDILDQRILIEGKEDDFLAFAKLAKNCLNMNGRQRPTMKEIAVILDGIRSADLPDWKEPRPAERNHMDTELIHSYSGSFSRSIFSSDDDPPASSIEVQPLMTDS